MHSTRFLLDRARGNGYLNAAGALRPELLRAYGLWCWKLRIPLVCFERNTPRSKFGSVHLDLFTTGHLLTGRGRNELATLPGRATISRYDGVWQKVPLADLENTARAVYRLATRRGNYEMRPAGISPELSKLIAAIHQAIPLSKSA